MNIIQDKEYASPDEFYTSLKEKLTNTHNFPEDYLFKFILDSDHVKMMKIYQVFDGTQHTIQNRESKNGNYTAVNVNAFVLDADHVIRIYKEVAEIEGVMML